jgi:hypothetical protein
MIIYAEHGNRPYNIINYVPYETFIQQLMLAAIYTDTVSVKLVKISFLFFILEFSQKTFRVCMEINNNLAQISHTAMDRQLPLK